MLEVSAFLPQINQMFHREKYIYKVHKSLLQPSERNLWTKHLNLCLWFLKQSIWIAGYCEWYSSSFTCWFCYVLKFMYMKFVYVVFIMHREFYYVYKAGRITVLRPNDLTFHIICERPRLVQVPALMKTLSLKSLTEDWGGLNSSNLLLSDLGLLRQCEMAKLELKPLWMSLYICMRNFRKVMISSFGRIGRK